MIVVHILISYGARSSGSFHHHPQYLAQFETYDRLCVQHPTHDGKVIVDHARKIRGLDQLPNLKAALLRLKELGTGFVFMDDLTRIFSRTPLNCRVALLSEMQEFAQHLYSVKHGRKLSALSEAQIRDMLINAGKVKLPCKKVANRDTTKARAASTASRSRKSKDLVARISTLKLELEAVNGKVTLQAVADEANRLGWQTSRGKVWTRQTVKKALDIVARPECI